MDDLKQVIEIVSIFGWKVGLPVAGVLLALTHGRKLLRSKASKATLDLAAEYADKAVKAIGNLKRHRDKRGVDPDRAPANGPAAPLSRDDLIKMAVDRARALAKGEKALKDWTAADWADSVITAYEEYRLAQEVTSAGAEAASKMRELVGTIERGKAEMERIRAEWAKPSP